MKTLTMNNVTYEIMDEVARNNVETLEQSLATVATTGSWNDLEDKPFYAEEDPSITFDGNTEGLTVLDLSSSWGVTYYKISDYIPELGQVMGQSFTDTSRQYVVTEDLVDPYCAEPAFMIGYSYLVVPEDNCAIYEDTVVAEKGLYAASEVRYIGIAPKIKYIDENVIPDTIARTEDIPTDMLSIDITDTDQGTATGINADTLGGVAADGYVLETELDTYKTEISSGMSGLESDISENAASITNLETNVTTNYLLKTETAANSSLLGGKAPIYYIQPRNLLDNSDFTNPVNQRGQTSYTGASGLYTIDRWHTSVNLNVAVNDGYINLSNEYESGRRSFTQRIENGFNRLAGKTVTVAVCNTDGVIACNNCTIPTSIPDSNKDCCYADFDDGSGAKITLTTAGNLDISIMVASSGTLNLTWAALYEGEYTVDTIPPYVPKGYTTELMECYRYYYRVGSDTLYSCIATGAVRESDRVSFFIKYPVEMRTTPTVTSNGELQLIPSYVPVIEIDDDVVGTKAASFYAIVDSSVTLTIANCYLIIAKTDQSAYIALSADL